MAKIYTPIKKCKGQTYLDAMDSLYSTEVSKIRQPIESLNALTEEKVHIQMASKVRPYDGLMVHIFGKLAVAMQLLMIKCGF